MPKLTPEQLAAIKNRCKMASDAPWSCVDEFVLERDGLYVAEIYRDVDSAFIAHARTDMPALLDHIKALEEENAQHKSDRNYWREVAREEQDRARTNGTDVDRLREENARYKEVLQRLDVANSLEYCEHGGLKFLPCSYCDAERSR